jgi:hypothetical protein
MRRRERGIALVVCILGLLLLTGLAVGLLYMTDSETEGNNNFRSSNQAYFAAMAGLQNVRERLTLANAGPHLLNGPATMIGGPNSILYVLNPAGAGDTVAPTNAANPYFDNELCRELTALGLNCALAGGITTTTPEHGPPYVNTPQAIPYKWVRVTQKANAATAPYSVASGGGVQPTTQICWNGSTEVPVTAVGLLSCDLNAGYSPVFLLTSYASTNSGATRMLQMEVAQDPPINTKGAVDSQDHVALNGQLDVNGWDYCTCSCTTSGTGNKKTTTCTSRAGKVCDASHYAIYASGTIDNPTPSETLIAGTSPPYVQNQPWPYDVNSLVNQMRSAPGAIDVTQSSSYNWNCTGGSCGTRSGAVFGIPPTFPPSPVDNPVGPANMAAQITYIPGDVQLTASAQGNGVLVVDGNLDVHGGLQFYGLIIVRGTISFTGGGSQATNIFGGIIAGQQSYVDNVLGGSAVVNFDRCALPGTNRNQPPRMLAVRDINF